MIIKPATRQEVDEWVRMRTLLWPDSADQHRKEILEYFDGVSTDIVETFVLFHDDEIPTGFIELNIRNFAEGSRNARVPYVEAWFVGESYRGHGYGGALMMEAEKWARRQGFSELASDTELHNELSISMHKHLGFEEVERVVCFLKALK